MARSVPLVAFFFVSTVTLSAVVACSASSSTPADATATQPTAPAAGDPGSQPDPPDEGSPKPAMTPADACGAVPKSQCTPANPGSVIRGIVKFDPKRYAGKKAPTLVLYLHHQIVVSPREAAQGGHPHAYKKVEVKDVTKGEAPFSLDLCEFGTAMYSEENCGFNLVAMLDEDGGNDPDNGATSMIPRKGQLVKMTPLDISCHKPSPCLTIQADCVDGDACTTFSPLKACKCSAQQKCPSDDKVCTD